MIYGRARGSINGDETRSDQFLDTNKHTHILLYIYTLGDGCEFVSVSVTIYWRRLRLNWSNGEKKQISPSDAVIGYSVIIRPWSVCVFQKPNLTSDEV